ncbi:MAG: FAD-binding protein, partial [Burkholderiales bacterium]|nr:FAD-binding protein [Burkholderiales bacterium]
ARDIGVQIRTGVRALKLITDGTSVHGVQADRTRFLAVRAVILSAGDFTNDPELKARYMGEREAKVEAVNETATGDGQKMAMELGAR